MFTLRLFVMGLVAFVPSDNGNDLTLVLQETRGAKTEHQHYPILVCDRAQSECDVYPDTANANEWRSIVEHLNLARDPDTLGLGLLLAGEQITIEGAQPGFVDLPRERFERRLYHKLSGICPRALRTAADARWMPAVSRLHDDSSVIAERHVFDPAADEVAALFSLHAVEASVMSYSYPAVRGRYRASVRSLTFKKEPPKWLERLDWPPFNWIKKIPPLVTERHAAPDVMLVEILVPDVEASLVLRGFDRSTTRRLSVAPLPGRKVVDVLLGNLTPLPEPEAVHTGSTVPHFDFYYTLSEDPPSRRRLPGLGWWRVEAGRVTRDRPSVIDMVSKRGRGAGGADRPVCTHAEYSAPMDGVSLRLAALRAQRTASPPPPPPPASSVESILESGWFEGALTYQSAGETRTFRARDDAVVLAWPEDNNKAEQLKSAIGGVRPLVDARSEGFRVVASSLDELQEHGIGKEMLDAAEARVMPVLVDETQTLRYFSPNHFRVWVKSVRDMRGFITSRGFTLLDHADVCSGYFTVKVPEDLLLFEAMARVNSLLTDTPFPAIAQEEVLVEPAEVALARLPVTLSPFDRSCSEWGTRTIRAREAWNNGARGQNVVVAVVDSGIDLDHPQFKDRLANQGDDDWDFVDDDKSPDEMDSDHLSRGHGTHVAGIVAAVAPESEIMPLRINLDDTGADRPIVQAICHVRNKAKASAANGGDGKRYVLNLSWSLVVDRPDVLNAIQQAVAEGVVVAAAAGNGPHDLGVRREFPAAYPEPPPATHPPVITVAATYRSDRRAFDSNYGTLVDVSAPGWNVESAWPMKDDRDPKTRCADGTSSSTAYVSGVAALLLSKKKGLTPQEVEAAIENGSDPIDDDNEPRFRCRTAGNNQFVCQLGRGRVNAKKALEAPQ